MEVKGYVRNNGDVVAVVTFDGNVRPFSIFCTSNSQDIEVSGLAYVPDGFEVQEDLTNASFWLPLINYSSQNLNVLSDLINMILAKVGVIS